MSAILKFNFQKENNYIFQKKLPKQHEKDTIFHVTITFSQKQGKTRTSIVAVITPPLKFYRRRIRRHDKLYKCVIIASSNNLSFYYDIFNQES